MAWTVWGSNPGGVDVSLTRPDRPRSPHSVLYNGHRFYFPEVKRPGFGVDHPRALSAKVNESLELYLYKPSGHLWPVQGELYL